MAGRDEIAAYANALLEVERWPEFAPPGLQVLGAEDVGLLLCGVSSSRDLFEHAADIGAQMVLVHHGLFWRNEPLVVDRRLRGRLEALFRANASLLAYHLALDAHAELGNAAQLAARLGGSADGPFGGVGVSCTLDGLTIEELTARVTRSRSIVSRSSSRTGRSGSSGSRSRPALPATTSSAPPTRGSTLCSQASRRSRIPRPRSELGIHLLAAGHHATERFGVQALAEHLASTFAIEWRYHEIPNPV